jgi:hypothetical protein
MLVGNRSVLAKSPLRYLAGQSLSGNRNNYNQSGQIANIYQAVNKKTFLQFQQLPRTGGGMYSHNDTELTVTGSGQAWAGISIDGSTTFVITPDTATALLIASGGGSASFLIDTNNPLLTASLSATGSDSMSFSINSPILGAKASLSGTATSSFTGTLTPYAIGYMEGTNANSGGAVLTEDSIANAVWSQMVESGVSASEVMQVLLAINAGQTVIVDNGNGTATVTFKSQSGTDRVVASVNGSERASVTI